MDEAGVDLAIVSLSSPNVFLVQREYSVKAARAANEDFAAAAARYPDRIKWMASLPWDFAPDAIAELRRAKDAGAVAICMLTNIAGKALTEESYRGIWPKSKASDCRYSFIRPCREWTMD